MSFPYNIDEKKKKKGIPGQATVCVELHALPMSVGVCSRDSGFLHMPKVCLWQWRVCTVPGWGSVGCVSALRWKDVLSRVGCTLCPERLGQALATCDHELESVSWKRIIFLVIFKITWRRREGERGRETSMWERNINWLPLVHTLTRMKPQPRLVPQLGIEPATFVFAGWYLTNWATPIEVWVFIWMFVDVFVTRNIPEEFTLVSVT